MPSRAAPERAADGSPPSCAIIVANYDNTRFLPTLVESVLAQTDPDWELVIADDGSHDSPDVVLESFLTDRRISFLPSDENRGAAVTFRRALDASTAPVVAMLGADDALVETAVARIVQEHAEHAEASMVIGSLVECDAELRPVGRIIERFDVPPGGTVLDTFGVAGWATFKRRHYRLTEGFDDSLSRAVDQDMYIKLEEVGTLHTILDALYLYRQHDGGISQGRNRRVAHEFNYAAKLRAYERRLRNGYVPNLSAGDAARCRRQRDFLHALNALSRDGPEALLHSLRDDDAALFDALIRESVEDHYDEIRLDDALDLLLRLRAANTARRIHPERPFASMIRTFTANLLRQWPAPSSRSALLRHHTVQIAQLLGPWHAGRLALRCMAERTRA